MNEIRFIDFNIDDDQERRIQDMLYRKSGRQVVEFAITFQRPGTDIQDYEIKKSSQQSISNNETPVLRPGQIPAVGATAFSAQIQNSLVGQQFQRPPQGFVMNPMFYQPHIQIPTQILNLASTRFPMIPNTATPNLTSPYPLQNYQLVINMHGQPMLIPVTTSYCDGAMEASQNSAAGGEAESSPDLSTPHQLPQTSVQHSIDENDSMLNTSKPDVDASADMISDGHLNHATMTSSPILNQNEHFPVSPTINDGTGDHSMLDQNIPEDTSMDNATYFDQSMENQSTENADLNRTFDVLQPLVIQEEAKDDHHDAASSPKQELFVQIPVKEETKAWVDQLPGVKEEPKDCTNQPVQTKTWASLFRNTTAATNAIIKKSAATSANHHNHQNASHDSTEDESVQRAIAASIKDTVEWGFDYSVKIDTNSINSDDLWVSVTKDPLAKKLAKVLKEYTFVTRGPTYALRGIVNRGNWCYVNATLQALMACPTFFHFMRHIMMTRKQDRSPSSTPLLDAFIKLVSEFALLKELESKRKETLALDPVYMHSIISQLKTDASFKGRQEDAEELLLFVINRLHEEMVAVLSLNCPEKGDQRCSSSHEEMNNSNESPISGGWQQVSPGRRAPITRHMKYAQSPISQIFSGQLRYGLCQPGAKESATLEPFFTLPLDVQLPGVKDIVSALHAFTSKEVVKNFQGKNNVEVDATRRVTFHDLPPVLIFQLKYFVYAEEGLKKIVKAIEYSMDLFIEPSFLSNQVKLTLEQRKYKLFAVVFHHGEKAEGGHYTVDVFHGGHWVHIDDTKTEFVKNDHVLNYQPPRVPYLLFYRRWEASRSSAEKGSVMSLLR